MKRFQNALKKQLASQHEKVRLESSELTEALKRKMAERESIGVELYGVQQELARYSILYFAFLYLQVTGCVNVEFTNNISNLANFVIGIHDLLSIFYIPGTKFFWKQTMIVSTS